MPNTYWWDEIEEKYRNPQPQLGPVTPINQPEVPGAPPPAEAAPEPVFWWDEYDTPQAPPESPAPQVPGATGLEPPVQPGMLPPDSPFGLGLPQVGGAPVPFDQTIPPQADPLAGMSWQDIQNQAAMRAEMEQLAALSNPDLAMGAPPPPEAVPAPPPEPEPVPIESELDIARRQRAEKNQARRAEGTLDAAVQQQQAADQAYVEGLSGPETFALEAAAAMKEAPGIFAKMLRSTKSEEKLEQAQYLAGMTEGVWNKAGAAFGMMGPAVVDIMALHGVAGALGPALTEMGYARTGKALSTIARDPGEWLADGNKLKAFYSLLGEELPFVAADVAEGRDLRTIVQNAVIGVGAGGAAEAGLARMLPGVRGGAQRATPDVPFEPRTTPFKPGDETSIAEGGPGAAMRIGDALEGGKLPEIQDVNTIRQYVEEGGAEADQAVRDMLGEEADAVLGTTPVEPKSLDEGENWTGARMMKDGKIYGQAGDTHEIIRRRHPDVDFGEADEGFGTDAGRYVARGEMQQYGVPDESVELSKVPEGQAMRQAMLEAEDFPEVRQQIEEIREIPDDTSPLPLLDEPRNAPVTSTEPQRAQVPDQPVVEPMFSPESSELRDMDAGLGRQVGQGEIQREMPAEWMPEENQMMPPYQDDIRLRGSEDLEEAGLREAEIRAYGEVEPDDMPIREFDDPGERYRDALENEAMREAEIAAYKEMDPPEAMREIETRAPERGGEILEDMNPQERHSLGYRVAAQSIYDIGKSRLGKAFQRTLGMASDVPQKIFDTVMNSKNFLKGQAFQANEHLQRASDMMIREYGARVFDELDQNPNLFAQIRYAANTDRPYRSADMTLPKPIFDEIRKVRLQVDALSDTMIAEGLVSGKLRMSVSDRMGTWLVRSYRKFQDPEFKADFDDVVHAEGWAKEYYGMSEAEAKKFVWELQTSDYADAFNALKNQGRKLERANLRLEQGMEAKGSLEALSGYVPTKTRDQLIEILDNQAGETTRLIDEFISGGDVKERTIIDALEAKREAIRRNIGDLEIVPGQAPGTLAPGFQGKANVIRMSAEEANARIENIDRLIDELWRRKEIPEPIRALWGEVHNPLERLAATVDRASQIVAGARNAQNIIKEGSDLGLVRTTAEATGLNPKDWKRISAGDSKLKTFEFDEERFGKELWIHKDLEDALDRRFNNEFGPISGARQMFLAFNHLVKGNMTFRNPGTHFRNFFGASFFTAAGGLSHPFNVPTQIRRIKAAAKIASSARAVKAGKLDDNMTALVADYLEKGLLDSSVLERGLADNLEELAKTGNFAKWSENYRAEKLSEKAMQKVSNVDNYVREVYRMEDDIARVVVYHGELEELERLKWKKPEDRIARATQLARDTYPNYDMLPIGIQNLRRNPLVSAFPSFAWETLRVTKNQIVSMMDEFNDPVLRPRAIRRAMGMAQVAAAPTAATLLGAKFLAGMGPAEQGALRRDQGEYQKFNSIVPIHRNEDGTVNYIDLGYTNPFNLLVAAVTAMADTSIQEGRLGKYGKISRIMKAGLGEISDPFIQQEIVFGGLMELANNQDKWGRKVRREDHFLMDAALHMLKRFEPGISKPIRRMAGAAQGDFTSNLTRPPLWAEGMELFGARVRVSNPKKEYDWRLGQANADLTDATFRLKSVLNNKNEVSDRDLERAYDEYELERRRAMLEAIKATEDTRLRRNPAGAIESSIKDVGFEDKETQQAILYGGYLPKKFGPRFMRSMQEDFARQAVTEGDAMELWGRIEERIQKIRQLSEARRAGQ